MGKLLIFLAMAIPVLLLACGGGASEDEAIGLNQTSFTSGNGSVIVERVVEVEKSVAAAAVAPQQMIEVIREVAVEREVIREDGLRAATSGAGALETADRQVISSASVAVEVEDVQAATAEVRLIAEGFGGFVEQLSSSGGPERQRATMTVRVPQDQFFSALERIELLGSVQSQNLGSEDVSEQFIDLEARLKSSLREEQSLLSLLERTDTVSEVLTIERELSRVRSDIERFQGQLNFLERRVDLATISVSLFPPEVETGEPPSAALTLSVSDVDATVDRVKGLVRSLDGVIDLVFLAQRDDKQQADLSLRVFTAQFDQAMDFFEGQGKVLSKELSEGKLPSDGSSGPNVKPTARVGLTLLEEVSSSNTGLIVAIAAPLGGVALAGILGVLFFWTYRTGRRRGVAA